MRQQTFEAALKRIVELVRSHPSETRDLLTAAYETDDAEEAALLAIRAGRLGVARLREIKKVAEEALK